MLPISPRRVGFDLRLEWEGWARRGQRVCPTSGAVPWPRCQKTGGTLERDDLSLNRHPALASCFEHDLFRKPLDTFRDHALARGDTSFRLPYRTTPCE